MCFIKLFFDLLFGSTTETDGWRDLARSVKAYEQMRDETVNKTPDGLRAAERAFQERLTRAARKHRLVR